MILRVVVKSSNTWKESFSTSQTSSVYGEFLESSSGKDDMTQHYIYNSFTADVFVATRDKVTTSPISVCPCGQHL